MTADLTLYYYSSSIAVRPHHATAREYLEEIGDKRASFQGNLYVQAASIKPLVEALVAHGFTFQKVMPPPPGTKLEPLPARLVLGDGGQEGRWLFYTGGQNIPDQIIKMILVGAGGPN
jgi:hypothetical protein